MDNLMKNLTELEALTDILIEQSNDKINKLKADNNKLQAEVKQLEELVKDLQDQLTNAYEALNGAGL